MLRIMILMNLALFIRKGRRGQDKMPVRNTHKMPESKDQVLVFDLLVFHSTLQWIDQKRNVEID